MRTIVRIVALWATVLAAGPSLAQQYPSKPVRIVVPFAPGGVIDITARLVGQKLSEHLGQQFYVENYAGGGGNIGMGNAARAAGDGYTILFASSSFVVNPSLYNTAPYDPDKDFVPVTKANATPNLWMVHLGFPASSVKELVELIKASPGTYNVASPGIGTTPHLSIELFRLSLGLDYVTVPFGGGGPAAQSVIAGHTPIACMAMANVTNLVREGKLRGLALTAAKRSSALDDIPTLDELGIKGQEAETMTGVFVPTGTPKPIVDLIQREIAAIVTMADVKTTMESLGFEPAGSSSAEFAAYVQAEIAKWKKVIEDAKINKI
jgi:tripartite-type tricarboxylate transporter receptor subunit TctC